MVTRALVGTRKGLFELTLDKGSFKPSAVFFAGDNVSMLLCDPRDGAWYAVLGHGHFGIKLHRSDDQGKTWTEVGVPVYPPKPDGEVDVDPVRKTPLEWSLEWIWSLAPGHASQPGRLWAGTVPGGLFRSDDRGESWELVRSLWDRPERRKWAGGGMERPGIHSIVVDPRDGRRLWVAISCGGVWSTADDGVTWSLGGPGMHADFMPPDQAHDPNVQDVHRLVGCQAAPDVLWVQHHNGIYRSNDAARSWQEIPSAGPSTFGFPVAVHPSDPNTAWFVPAKKDEHRIPVDGKVVVTRTRDGGQTFDTLSRGLPQAWAYDLVYRHALDVDHTGRHLLFGSTTGNLFASADAGDSWSVISTHLPPIYVLQLL